MIDMPQDTLFDHKSHVEITTVNHFQNTEWVKHKAYKAMDELEGWCSKEKAGIMIDFIRMIHAKTIVEIGVYGGKSLVPMAFAVEDVEGGKVYGIDPWSSAASVQWMDPINGAWWGNLDHMQVLKNLVFRIKKFNMEDKIQLIQATSQDAPLITNIDVLHIDGNHSDEASMIDVLKWVPQVRKGGLIFFDDITWSNGGKAVAWMDANCIRLVDFLGKENEWGIWVKP